MISGLRGRINRFGPSRVHLEASGVEYEVQVPLNVFESLQMMSPGSELYLFIHHQFLQDEQRLFGFLEQSQRDLFGALQTIKGLGTQLALSILSHLDGPTLFSLCERGDTKSLSHIPRVGKSTAETLVFEVNRKKERWKKMLVSEEGTVSLPVHEEDLAFQALLQLGYKESSIRSALQEVQRNLGGDLRKGSEAAAAEWIKEALRIL